MLVSLLGITCSCEDMLKTDSNLVMYADQNKLNSAMDTVYSVIGIVNKMQTIADRTVLLGELRGDLVQVTSSASEALQQLANFTVADTATNVYNSPKDYYAIINNCNYFLANADTTLKKRNKSVFIKEYAVIKAYRAWTYLQLAQIYGKVPFYTEPILTEAQANKTYPMYGITDICNYFIDDLKPYIDTDLPSYGTINGWNSTRFFIPVRMLLGDLCLWAGRYKESAQYYHDYLSNVNDPMAVGFNRLAWQSSDFKGIEEWLGSGRGSRNANDPSDEVITYIPMDSTAYSGTTSDLPNIYNSTTDNNDYFQVTPSVALKQLSASQVNCLVYTNGTQLDTVYAPTSGLTNDLEYGDLRLATVYTKQTVSQSSSKYSTNLQDISKFETNNVSLYRTGLVYLRYAEALNRAGFPSAAFAVLKYGLISSNIVNYVDTAETAKSGSLFTFNENYFTADNTLGLHSRGCGYTEANQYYTLPVASTQDSVITKVEDLICDEMALETSFEGYRYYDLMRIALRRGEPDYLAKRVANRSGSLNGTLYSKLLNESNWYLPLK